MSPRPNVRLIAEGAWTETCPNFRDALDADLETLKAMDDAATIALSKLTWFLAGLALGLVVALEWL
jgi:hypothetical protein